MAKMISLTDQEINRLKTLIVSIEKVELDPQLKEYYRINYTMNAFEKEIFEGIAKKLFPNT